MMKPRQLINLITLAIALITNWLAISLPLNGKMTGAISDQFPLYFTPAGYVFSIWSVIYLGLIAFGVYQALPSQRDNPRLERVGYWFALSNVLNAIWIFLWHYEQFVLTLVVMLALLVSLVMVYLKLGIGRAGVSTREKLLVNLPFSIYLGWISVATIANTSIVLYTQGWNGGALGPIVVTEIMIAIAALLAIAMKTLRSDVAYPLVFVWASVGIAVSNLETPVVKNTAILAAVAVAFSILLVTAWRLAKQTRQERSLA